MEVAEFAVARGIDKETAFALWVPFTLFSRDCIISFVTTGVKQISHKYSVEIARQIKESFTLNAKNESKWRNSLKKKMDSF